VNPKPKRANLIALSTLLLLLIPGIGCASFDQLAAPFVQPVATANPDASPVPTQVPAQALPVLVFAFFLLQLILLP
jgi:hypothetical protein